MVEEREEPGRGFEDEPVAGTESKVRPWTELERSVVSGVTGGRCCCCSRLQRETTCWCVCEWPALTCCCSPGVRRVRGSKTTGTSPSWKTQRKDGRVSRDEWMIAFSHRLRATLAHSHWKPDGPSVRQAHLTSRRGTCVCGNHGNMTESHAEENLRCL